MIPATITRQDLLAAIAVIDQDGVPAGRAATRFALVYQGKLYPPKYVVALASRLRFGTLLSSSAFGGGKETNGFLAARGFEVKLKGSGFVTAPPRNSRIPRSVTPQQTRRQPITFDRHDQRCKECKTRIEELLRALYGTVRRNFSLAVASRPEGYRGNPDYGPLVRIYDALRNRAACDFVRVDTLPNCDYFVETPGFILEFDESQHFTSARACALQQYDPQWNIGFSITQWLSLCEQIRAKDNHPPFRDEQRAWYDTLRDFAPPGLKLHPTVRLYASEYDWCALDPTSPGGLETFRHLISDRTDFWKLQFRFPQNPVLSRVVIDGRWRADVASAHRLLENICNEWPQGRRVNCVTTPGAFLRFEWPDAIRGQKNSCFPDAAAYNCLVQHAEQVCRTLLDQSLIRRLQRCTDYLTIGIDTKKEKISRTDAHIPQPHAELVTVVDLRSGVLCTTGKSYPTTNQQRGLLRNLDLASHFVTLNGVSTMVLGCHDLMMYHPRSDAKATGWRSDVKTKFKQLAATRRPEWVLHHPHTAVKVGTWNVAWRALLDAVPSVTSYIGSGAYSSKDDGWSGRAARDLVLTSTASRDVLDIIVTLAGHDRP